MPPSRPVRRFRAGRPGSPCAALSCLQALARETAASAKDLGLRRIETSFWLGAPSSRQLVHVDVLGRTNPSHHRKSSGQHGGRCPRGHLSAKPLFFLPPEPRDRHDDWGANLDSHLAAAACRSTLNTPREAARINTVGELWTPPQGNVVAEAVDDILCRSIGDESLCFLHIRTMSLDYCGWQLGTDVDGGKYGPPGRIRDVDLPADHECRAILHYR